MSDPRICKQDEIDANAVIARRTGTHFGPVTITITDRKEVSTGKWQISFVVWGDSSGTVYSADWGDETQMWVSCPSDIPCKATPDDPGEPPLEHDTGKLYFSAAYIQANSWNVRPKWPTELGGLQQPTKSLEIFPCSVVITGFDTATGQPVKATIELTDHNLAAVNQNVVLDGKSPVTVNLTAAGFKKFGRPF